MEGAILTLIIVSPIACVLIFYRVINNGSILCVNTSNIDNISRVVVDNV